MGGNALKHLNPKRLTTIEVMNVYQRVATVARGWRVETHLVPWCFDKTEHGDVDILVDDSTREYRDLIADKLGVAHGPLHRKRNGDVLSIAVPIAGTVCQVDLINTTHENMPHTRLYYSGGGLGMLLGRVADHYGFVFAQEGLRLRSDAHQPWSRDILLTRDPLMSLSVLEYDPHKAGAFETELDCWKYALSSPRARPYMFLPSKTNAENRSRDKQRPGHIRFQEWIKANYLPEFLEPKEKRHFELALAESTQVLGYVRNEVAKQKKEWEDDKRMNYAFGLGAVAANWPDMSPEDAGSIVRLMQKELPDKATRKKLWENPSNHGWLAKLAAGLAYKVGTTGIYSSTKDETK